MDCNILQITAAVSQGIQHTTTLSCHPLKRADVLKSDILKVLQYKSQLLLITNNLCTNEAQIINISRNYSPKDL